jgi:hypothetical protein
MILYLRMTDTPRADEDIFTFSEMNPKFKIMDGQAHPDV